MKWSRQQSISELKAVCNPVLHMSATFLLTDPSFCILLDIAIADSTGMWSQTHPWDPSLQRGSWDLGSGIWVWLLIGPPWTLLVPWETLSFLKGLRTIVVKVECDHREETWRQVFKNCWLNMISKQNNEWCHELPRLFIGCTTLESLSLFPKTNIFPRFKI